MIQSGARWFGGLPRDAPRECLGAFGRRVEVSAGRPCVFLFEQCGIESLTSFDVGGSTSYLSAKQEDDLKAWVGATLPRSTRRVGSWIEEEFGLVYESSSGLIALLHRLGLEYHKPDAIPRKLDEEKQKAFIESYDASDWTRAGDHHRGVNFERGTSLAIPRVMRNDRWFQFTIFRNPP